MSDDLPRLKLAFAYHVITELVRADGQISDREVAFITATFPGTDLARAGFVDVEGRMTQTFVEARDRALVELQDRLSEGDKLVLIQQIADASAADGVLMPEEADALSAIAAILGVADRLWLDHLEGLIAGGTLRRDETGIA